MLPLHRNKVLSDWLHSAGDQSAKVDLDVYRKYVEPLLEHVTVVSPVDWPAGVTAWLCHRDGVLEYVYVSKTYRRLGIADYLLGDLKLHSYTFKRPPYSASLSKRYGLEYRPWSDK